MKPEAKTKLLIFIFTLYFLDCFSLIFAKIRWELSEIHGTERLFIDEFCHDVEQPSP